MSSEMPVQKPTSVIFLDIDGVLIEDRFCPPLKEKINDKLTELFEKKVGLNGGFTELESRIAASHFFSKKAVANLDSLIEKVSQVAQVAIVISSAWRNDGTVQELKESMFAACSFSKFIIDKTPDDSDKIHISPISEEKYGFDLRRRGRQIDYWLRENHEKLNIKSFAILDDVDEEISERYPHHFVKVSYTLSESDVDKAYNIMSQLSFSSQNIPLQSTVADQRKENCKVQ